jgi:hypothetical protein
VYSIICIMYVIDYLPPCLREDFRGRKGPRAKQRNYIVWQAK